MTWLHPDHLGSAVAGTSSTGAVAWRESKQPFGEDWISAPSNDNQPGFTGHVEDDATGLVYMQARYYDPVIGRFLANDPVGFSPARPDMFNRYVYAGNDPVNMWDPDGKAHFELNLDGKLVPGLGFGGGPSIVVSFPVPNRGDVTPFDIGFSYGLGPYAGAALGADISAALPRATSNPEAYKSGVRGVFLVAEASAAIFGGLGVEYRKELSQDPFGYGGDQSSENIPVASTKSGARARTSASLRLGVKTAAVGGFDVRYGFTLREALSELERALGGALPKPTMMEASQLLGV